LTTSFIGWGNSWGNSWGDVAVNPGDISGSASITFTASGLATANQVIDPLIQVITGNVQRMRKTYEEEKRKTEEFITFNETVKPRKQGTITLSQLVGKKAAAQINSIDVEEKIQKAQRAKRRQQDDEFMLMM
jgi:hypothetical protein